MEDLRIIYNPPKESESPFGWRKIAGLIFGVSFWIGVFALLFFIF